MNNLKRLRYDAELSLRELADATGLVHTTISRLEMGTRKFSSKHIAVLCGFFDVTSDYLLGRSDSGIGIYLMDSAFGGREHRFVSEREYADMRLREGYSQRVFSNGSPIYISGGGGADDYAIPPKSIARSLIIEAKESDDAEKKRTEIKALLDMMDAKELDKTLRFIKEYIK